MPPDDLHHFAQARRHIPAHQRRLPAQGLDNIQRIDGGQLLRHHAPGKAIDHRFAKAVAHPVEGIGGLAPAILAVAGIDHIRNLGIYAPILPRAGGFVAHLLAHRPLARGIGIDEQRSVLSRIAVMAVNFALGGLVEALDDPLDLDDQPAQHFLELFQLTLQIVVETHRNRLLGIGAQEPAGGVVIGRVMRRERLAPIAEQGGDRALHGGIRRLLDDHRRAPLGGVAAPVGIELVRLPEQARAQIIGVERRAPLLDQAMQRIDEIADLDQMRPVLDDVFLDMVILPCRLGPVIGIGQNIRENIRRTAADEAFDIL